MANKATIERKLAAAREAAAREAWREAATAAAAAAAAWPEPPGWFGRFWRRWQAGALLDALEAEAPTWRTKAGEVCLAHAHRLIEQSTTDPAAGMAIKKLQGLGEEADRWGHPDAGTIHVAVQTWQARLATYEGALRRGEEAMGGKRYIDAAEAFEAARAAFPSAAAGAGLTAARAGADQERAYLERRSKAGTDVAAGRYACAVVRLEAALATFPREDGERELVTARGALTSRDAFLEGAQAARAGEWGRAERAFATAAEAAWSVPTGVGTPEARWWQAAMAMQRGAPERALRSLVDAGGPEAELRRGLALAALGRFRAADEALRGAGRPEVAEAARQAAEHRTFVTERAIADRLETEDVGAAIELANAHLAVEDDAAIRTLLDGHLEPRRLGAQWRTASAAQRVVDAAAQLRKAPDPGSLHTWLVALDAEAARDDAQVADWLVATAAVLANLHASPAFTTPHRAWTLDERQAIKALLRDHVEQRLDAARESSPARERAWRDAWRVELAALELAEAGQRMPQLGELALTPGLWCWLGQPASTGPAPGKAFDAMLFAALYSPWGQVVAAWRAGDPSRAAELRPPSPGTDASATFGLQVLEIERALALLAAGDLKGWDHASTARPLLEVRHEWRAALDALGERQMDMLPYYQGRPFARRWHEVLGSKDACRWHVTMETEALRKELAGEKISDSKAQGQLDALLKLDPQNPVASQLRQMLADKKVVAEVELAMKRNRFEEAVAIARRKGSPEVRALVAGFCFQILDDNFNQGMSYEEARFLARSARDLVPDNPLYREVAQKLGV